MLLKEYGFRARFVACFNPCLLHLLTKISELVYKNRIRRRGLDKKCKEHEMRAIRTLHDQRPMEGKESSFLRGRKLELANAMHNFRCESLQGIGIERYGHHPNH